MKENQKDNKEIKKLYIENMVKFNPICQGSSCGLEWASVSGCNTSSTRYYA